MNFLHQEFDAGPSDVIEVMLDGQANVMLLDPSNYNNYRNNRTFKYIGGLAKVSPMRLALPRQGRWHVVVDLGGYAGTVRAGVQLLQGANF